MLPPLVQEFDPSMFGLTASAVAITRASARVRGHLGQRVSVGTSTITARGPVILLPQRPVQAVTSVTAAGQPVTYTLEGAYLTVDSLDTVQVTYDHGYPDRAGSTTPDLPDELVEMVCQMAARLSAPVDPAMASGVQQQGIGPFSIAYGMDAWRGQTGLTQAEKDLLRRYWPRLPRPINTGV